MQLHIRVDGDVHVGAGVGVVGLVAAAHIGWLRYALLAVATGAAAAGPYLFLLDYAAPRFLLTAYGLLAIPVATAVLWLTSLGGARARELIRTLVVAALVVHLVIQLDVLRTIQQPMEQIASRHSEVAASLRDQHAVRQPCLVWGEGAVELSYLLKCRSVWEPGGDAPTGTDPHIPSALARDEDLVVRIRHDEADELPAFMTGWQPVALPGTGFYLAYLPPARPLPQARALGRGA